MPGETHCRTNNNTEWHDYYCESRPIRSPEDNQRLKDAIHLSFLKRYLRVNGKFPWEETEEEQTGGKPTMVSFKEGDRVRHINTDRLGKVVKTYPSGGVQVHWDKTGMQSRVMKANLNPEGQVERNDNSDASSANSLAATVDKTVESMVNSFETDDEEPDLVMPGLVAMLFLVASALQVMTTGALGECSTATPMASSSDFGHGDGTSIPCAHKTVVGANFAQWSVLFVVLAQLVWQKTRLAEESTKVNVNTLYRSAHWVFVATCWLELWSKDARLLCCPLVWVSTSLVVWLFAGTTTEGTESGSQVHSSNGSSETTDRPAWCVSESPRIALLRLGVLFSLTSLKDVQEPLFGQIVASIVMVLYVAVGQCAASVKGLQSFFQNCGTMVTNGAQNCMPDTERALMCIPSDGTGGGDHRSAGLSKVNTLIEGQSEILERQTEILKELRNGTKRDKLKSALTGTAFGTVVSVYTNQSLLERLGLVPRQDRLGRSLFVNDPDQFWLSSFFKFDQEGTIGSSVATVLHVVESALCVASSAPATGMVCLLLLIAFLVAHYKWSQPACFGVGLLLGGLVGFLGIPLGMTCLAPVWACVNGYWHLFFDEARIQLFFLAINFMV